MSSDGLHPRAAKYRSERLRDLLSHLHLAKRVPTHLGFNNDTLDSMVKEYGVELEKLTSRAGERIESRKRSVQPINDLFGPKEYFLFLDECGSHVVGTRDSNFPVFCLCGTIMSKDSYLDIDLRWKEWKAATLGSADVIVHEPDVRHRSKRFRGDTELHTSEIHASLNTFLSGLDMKIISVVVDLNAFEELYPSSLVDDFLPVSCYLMSIDFVLERFLHFLQARGEGSRGMVVAESRGTYEDAQVHAEFIRLHLEGTQFVSESSFRAYLRPYIEFFRKGRNHSGLQIADLAARPCADKVLNTSGNPVRWDIFSPKLYDGECESPHKYGLKVFPLTELNDPFPDLPRKAKEGAAAPPVTD